MKDLYSLPSDIDQLFVKKAGVNEELLQSFCNNIGDLLRRRLTEQPEKDFRLRFSKLGTPDRKLWYEAHTEQDPHGQVSNALKFLYGDIVEQLVIYLAKEAGHLVEDEQLEVDIKGVKGHTDCTIDGIAVDIKSASSFAFKKFLQGTLYKDDPFGYIAQLSGYMQATGKDKGAFVAVNKESGEITVLPLDSIDSVDASTRIDRMREVISAPTPPQTKCYEPEKFGESGNLKLNKNCSYCPFKDQCWSDANGGVGLRKFNYSGGVVDFVSVVNTPRVEEVTFSQGGLNQEEQK